MDRLSDYYAERVDEYERVYALPERQADLARLRARVEQFARGRRILELACGTGYWTAVLSRTATSVLATDVGQAVLERARGRGLSDHVVFQQADAFALDGLAGDWDAGFAAFWWSHVPLAALPRFLRGFHRCLGAKATVQLVDNRYVGGSSTPILRSDREGNTYQQRVLANGRVYEVLKNFPAASEVRRQIVACGVTDVEVGELEHYWYATYRLGQREGGNVSAP